ncbi:MAG: hypothetical protein CSA42_01165 [Gammaproteobacteria bacterium]|nr:MAG: hypothetical protein CSA42_01165 [Gammaproteobacteria bacterium]
MTENEEFIYDSIVSQIKMGFFSIEEIEENILEEIEDNEFEEEISEEWALKNISEEFKKHKEKSKNFKKPSDTEKLIEAFDTLCKNNIIALHNAGYTSSDGDYEVVEVERELREKNVVSDGYCFYHQQDLEGVLETNKLYIRFNKVDNNDDEVTVNVGKKVVEILKEFNFNVEWNETVNQRISINDFEWEWIYDENNRDLLDYDDVIEMMIK